MCASRSVSASPARPPPPLLRPSTAPRQPLVTWKPMSPLPRLPPGSHHAQIPLLSPSPMSAAWSNSVKDSAFLVNFVLQDLKASFRYVCRGSVVGHDWTILLPLVPVLGARCLPRLDARRIWSLGFEMPPLAFKSWPYLCSSISLPM